MRREQPVQNPWGVIRQGTGYFLILILFTLSIVQQSEAGWIHTESEEFAEQFIYLVQKGDLTELNKHLEPGLLSEENQQAVQKAIDIFPRGNIKKITRLNLKVNYDLDNEGRTEELQFFVLMDTTALIMEEVLKVKGDRYVVHGFHFNPAPRNMMRQFPFSLISWVQPKNVFMAAGVLNILLMIVALIFWFIKPIKMKLLWLPVIFAGITEASAQWVNDGPWDFNLLAIKVPSVWIDFAGQDPWSVVVSIPLGAAVVLFLGLTAMPEPEELTVPTRPSNGMPRRTPAQPRQRPRPQPVKTGK